MMKPLRRDFETNKSDYTMVGFELVKRDRPVPVLNSDSVKKTFPDWAEIKPGNWSKFSIDLKYGSGERDVLVIGLYREPIGRLGRVATYEDTAYGYYDGRYTLQIFDGNNVAFCTDVDDKNGVTI